MHRSRVPQIVGAGTLSVLMGLGILLSCRADDSESEREALATHLATLFRSARAVVSDSQALINDPAKADKGLTGEKVVQMTKAKYAEATGKELSSIAPDSQQGKLTQAMLDSVKEVMDQAQPLINKKDLGFKGFLPAVFAKQVADDFSRDTRRFAAIKLTAPKSYVRNRANAPDAWETNVIESKLKGKDWPQGKAFGEMGEHKGKRAFRLIIPEYYAESCLQCHGEPKGERDITGAKKEGGKLGDLGGAISVAIYQD